MRNLARVFLHHEEKNMIPTTIFHSCGKEFFKCQSFTSSVFTAEVIKIQVL